MKWFLHITAFCGFLGFAAVTLWLLREVDQQHSYLSVEAAIVDSRVYETWTGSGGKGLATRQFRPLVKYAYTIGGRRYESNQLTAIYWETSNPDAALQTVARYPVGSKVTAYVNPKNYGQAVLELGVSWWYIGAFLGAALFWLVLWEGLNRLLRESEEERAHLPHAHPA